MVSITFVLAFSSRDGLGRRIPVDRCAELFENAPQRDEHSSVTFSWLLACEDNGVSVDHDGNWRA